MNDEQIDKAEQLLGYWEQHRTDERVFPDLTASQEWWMGEVVAFMRDQLPEWSAFKAEGVAR